MNFFNNLEVPEILACLLAVAAVEWLVKVVSRRESGGQVNTVAFPAE